MKPFLRLFIFAVLFFPLMGNSTINRGLELFEDLSGSVPDANTPDDPTVMRSRPVSIRFDKLNQDSRSEGTRAGLLQLSLFPDAVFTAVLDRIEKNPSGSKTWIGHLDGISMSQVILVLNGEIMAGNISMPGAFYQVRYVEDGVHSIRQIDQSKFPESDDAIIPNEPAETKPPSDATLMKDSGSIVDVMVVYTQAARSAAGGTNAMNTLIDLAISETNTSYQNSGITHRLRLVHKAEVTYTEQGHSADLQNLASTTDSYMNEVHTLRNSYGADEVVLLVEGSSVCGVAYLMSTVSASFASSAFAVVSRSCATGVYSFGHEIGHNMGARHDRYVDNADTPYNTSHGYVDLTARWRTIMAYNDQCAATGSSCTRIQYWSNPNVSYQGRATGVASTSASAADNRTTLNNTAYTVANFRQTTDNLVILPNVPRYPKNQIVVSPYWQSDSDTYSFISVTHPSLSGMASAIGLKVSARNLAGSTVNTATFTVTADRTQKLFIIASNSSSYPRLNQTLLPQFNFMTNISTFLNGNLVITPVATDPISISSSGGNSDGFRDITTLSLWGAVIISTSSTGFTMEFIGDLADSRNPSSSTIVSAGVN